MEAKTAKCDDTQFDKADDIPLVELHRDPDTAQLARSPFIKKRHGRNPSTLPYGTELIDTFP